MASATTFASFLLASTFFLLVAPFHSEAVNDEKVNLTLYYESLCPYCSRFIVKELGKVLYTDLSLITNLRLVPFGNARIVKPGTVVCQHGEDECYFNMVEACAINAFPDSKKHFNFIQCVEKKISSEKIQNREEVWKSCCQKQQLRQKLISNCLSNGTGDQLILQYGDETIRLKHTFVPWVLVNDTPLKDNYAQFTAAICDAYKGELQPKACKSPTENQINNETSIGPVCRADKTT